jgi:NAD(P)-dependent dehydrogenase (short-subunit alcohol dehydrogenase family)
MQRLVDKVIIVAGGGTGIGAATAVRLAAEGARVVVGDIPGGVAPLVASRIDREGGQAIAVPFDITQEASVENLIGTAVRTYGGLDGIHVNAADLNVIMRDTDAVSVPLEVLDRTLDVNLRGHFLCTRHAVPELLKRGGGAIVYSTSTAAFGGEPERVAYAMSKSGLNALMRHVASRWGKEGIRANAVAPGLVVTEKMRTTIPPEFEAYALAATRSTRLGRPEDIAAMVALLMSADGEWINGQVLSVDGGAILRG